MNRMLLESKFETAKFGKSLHVDDCYTVYHAKKILLKYIIRKYNMHTKRGGDLIMYERCEKNRELR